MENVPEPSTSPCNNAHHIAAEDPEGEFFTMGHRRLFSAHSFSFSSEDLRSLDMDDAKLEDPSLGRGVSEDDPESETASSKASTSDSDGQQNHKSGPQWRGFFRKLKKGPAMGFHTFHPSIPAIKMLSRIKSRNSRKSLPTIDDPTFDTDLYCFKSSWKNFSLSELETATDSFSQENLIGEGGYSEVYKGHLEDGQLVAVKRLTRGSPEEMTADFLSELGILVHVNHPNIANVIGYGVEGGMHLVLHLSPHGSLASLLTGSKEKLEWEIRYKIALGTAEGLSYLHEGCQRRIIHRDIKAANVLLREDFEPQVSDFGLAKWLPEQWTHLTVSQFEGTFGYLPPEFFLHGIVDEKTDVYAYGVLLLELIAGRLALDKSKKSLVMWAKPLLNKNDFRELVDPSLSNTYNSEQLNRIVLTAASCLHESSNERPPMSKVVRMLKGEDINSSESAKKFRRQPVLKRTFSVGLIDTEEYNATRYLNDNQPIQIALEL
ncbi:receptor-like cytosolic serine/threonine-protein kinase RBK2 [Rhododendron vialii]|uniref:receptor-like cytosolic serine/threonine-protein kinase RBK2 n=1 Tax=Rhododendron vialii TaxID=182163 RepID=UPI00265F0474|nr:receptor-like cytosolic serine/threonine-protein kinase RBK2 [Rhododendron vialii]